MAGVYRSITEADKLSAERASENRRFFWTQFTPLLTSVILAGTLIFQIVQFSLTSKQQADQARTTLQIQVKANEDTQWREGLKILSDDKPIAQQAGIAFLRTYFSDGRYGAQSRHLALQVLAKSHSQIEFSDLFRALFLPMQWSDLDDVLLLDRDIANRYNYLDANPKTTAAVTLKVLLYNELEFLGNQVAPLFRSIPPTPLARDLSGAWFFSSDFSRVSLDGAILDNSGWYWVKLIDSDLGAVKSWDQSKWNSTAWWRARRIKSELLADLIRYFPFNGKSSDYQDSDPGVTMESYTRDVERLRKATADAHK